MHNLTGYATTQPSTPHVSSALYIKVYNPFAKFMTAAGALKSYRFPFQYNKRYKRLSSKLEEWVYQIPGSVLIF